MKKLNKLFLSITAGASLLAPTVNILTSCNKDTSSDYTTLANEIKTTALTEFEKINKIPRPSHHCEQIYAYLNKRIAEIGYTPKNDQATSGLQYGNIWFDVPATTGCENWEKVILQGHMDMVVAGIPEKDQTTTPIEAVRETIEDKKNPGKMVDVIHSKDYKTSLGADNGIGLSTILAIAQNKNLQHGPIRCVITYDEEDGTGGANHLDINTVFDTNNIINIDAEVDGGLFTGCYGIVQGKYERTFDTSEVTDLNTYSIRIKDFTGGHSGEDVGFRRANAERLGWEVLYELNNSGKEVGLMTVDHWDYDPVKPADSGFKHNSIIPYATFTIATNASKDDINNVITSLKDTDTTTRTKWTKYYSGEDWTKAHFEVNNKEDRLSSITKMISNEDTKKLASFFGGPLGTGLPCGVVLIKDEAKHIPAIGGNVGPSTFTTESKSTIKWKAVSSCRTYEDEIIDWMKLPADKIALPIQQSFSFEFLYKKAFGNTDGCDSQGHEYGWNDKEVNPLRDILIKGYKEAANMEPRLVSAYGVLECAGWFRKNNNLNIVSIGPRLEDCHTQKETLYVDTLNNEYKAIIYALNAMKK